MVVVAGDRGEISHCGRAVQTVREVVVILLEHLGWSGVPVYLVGFPVIAIEVFY